MRFNKHASSKTLSRLLALGLTFTTIQAKPVNVPVVYYKLPNGLKVVISEDHVAPVVTVAVYYNIGFRVEPKGRTGFAHLFEHMMFQGSENVKKFEHSKFVEANGGSDYDKVKDQVIPFGEVTIYDAEGNVITK